MGTLTSGHSHVLSGRAVTTATKQFLNSCHPSCHLNQINHYSDLREGEAPIYRIQMFPLASLSPRDTGAIVAMAEHMGLIMGSLDRGNMCPISTEPNVKMISDVQFFIDPMAMQSSLDNYIRWRPYVVSHPATTAAARSRSGQCSFSGHSSVSPRSIKFNFVASLNHE